MKTLRLAIIMLCLISLNAVGGEITGQITDQNNTPISFVNVFIKENKLGTVTNESGIFNFKNLENGDYTLVVSYIGFKTQERKIKLNKDEKLVRNFILTENDVQLSEVVVSGDRTMNEKKISIGKMNIAPLDLPQSSYVIDGVILEKQQTLRLSEALQNVTGIYQMGSTGGYQEELGGRGFNFGSSNTFKNGVRFNNSIMPEISSLEKVEILKGSSAILFGNVAAGGVLNLVTKKPKFENGGSWSLRTGSNEFYKPSFDIYGAFNNSNFAAYRIGMTYEKSNSFRDVVESERTYFNPSFLINVSENTNLLIEGDYLHDVRTPDFGTGAINYEIAEVPRNQFLNVSWAKNEAEQTSGTATLTHNLTNDWQIRFLTGIQNYRGEQFGASRPNAGTGIIRANGNWVRSTAKSSSSENYALAQFDITGNLTTGFVKHQVLIGVDADTKSGRSNAFASVKYDSINIFDLNQYVQRNDVPNVAKTTYTLTPVNRFGIYAQNLMHLNDEIKILAGIRWSYSDSRSEVYNALTNAQNSKTSNFDHAFSPRLGLVYQPLPNHSVFASYSNSFELNTGLDLNDEPLKPSYIDQFEIGTKNDFMDRLFSVNLTGYYIVNSNLAQSVYPQNPNHPNAKELAGEITSRGFELDFMLHPILGISAIAGYSFNDSEYSRSNIYIVGSRLRYNPAHTANASVRYEFDNKSLMSGLDLGLNIFYVGDRYAGRSTQLTIANDTRKLIAVPNYTQLDFAAGYALTNFNVKMKITNLTNQLSYYIHDDNAVLPIAPRQFSTTIEYKF